MRHSQKGVVCSKRVYSDTVQCTLQAQCYRSGNKYTLKDREWALPRYVEDSEAGSGFLVLCRIWAVARMW